MRASAPEGPRPEVRELANKVRAYRRFRAGAARAALEPASAVTGLDPWDAIWVREGVGFGRAASSGGAVESPARFPTVADDWSLPLHTGAGLHLALECLGGLGRRAGVDQLRPALEDFLDRCARGSLPGWRLAAVEALGFVVRVRRRRRTGDLDRLLAAVDPAARRAFWHGFGRGVYFSPREAVPLLAGSAVRRLQRLSAAAPDPEARDQAVAGWAWALTLVNLRHPAVVAAALRGSEAPSRPFADGAASALLVWRSSGGDARRVEAFLGHRPQEPTRAAPWQRLARSCRDVVQGAPAAGAPLGELFAYRPGRWTQRVPWQEEVLEFGREGSGR